MPRTVTRSGFGADLLDAIESFGVLHAEIDNIMEAALRDATEDVVAVASSNWPVGKRPKKPRKPLKDHSADLWVGRQIDKLTFEVHNSAGWAGYVHNQPKYGGPEPLADRVIPQLIDDTMAPSLIGVSERVRELIGGG